MNVGSAPRGLVLTDINNDTYPDLLVANSAASSSSISILLGNSNGTFQAATTLTVQSGSTQLVVADFNGDSIPDVAVANLISNSVSVARGNGNGTFQAAVHYPVGTSPSSIVALDLNSDSALDLAIANHGDGTISLLINQSGGTPPPPSVTPPTYTQSYVYDQIGNLLTKAGVSQQYGSTLLGTGTGPHQARSVGGAAYAYDANGNLLNGGGREYVWNDEQKPQSIRTIASNITETYVYDADGGRAMRTRGGITTTYAHGLWEQEGAIQRKYYAFQGQVIAVREGSLLTYLHGDQIGSVSATTNASGQLASLQYFDPWGQVLAGGIGQTRRGFTGQYLDETGLLFYNARYYDPGIGRFVSADAIVQDQGNPQAFNRYSYTMNNPVRYNDPSGHCIPGIGDCQPFWKTGGGPNWHDGGEFLLGVGEGVVNTVVGAVTAPIAAVEAIADPAAAIAGIQAQAAVVARGADMVMNDPSAAAAAINDDPRGIGQVMGQAAATAAIAVAAKGLGKAEGATCSFTAGTPVLTKEGSTPIGDLVEGDRVLAFNEATGTTGVYPVATVWLHRDPQIVLLTLVGETLETTPEHPFFVEGQGWVAASNLVEGDRVRRVDGTTGVVTKIVVETRDQVMYNLEVGTAHTFFVGEEGWLVHNACRPKGPDRTEPTLPNRTIAQERGVTIEHYYHGDEHGPTHAHVIGGGQEVRIGPNGKPVLNDPDLSAAQKRVISNNKSLIRSSLNKIGRWLDYRESIEGG